MNHSYPDRLSPAEQRAYDAIVAAWGDYDQAAAALYITRGTLKDALRHAKLKGYNWRHALEIPGLTVSETRAYQMRMSGMSYKQICLALDVKQSTVSRQLSAAYKVLGRPKHFRVDEK